MPGHLTVTLQPIYTAVQRQKGSMCLLFNEADTAF